MKCDLDIAPFIQSECGDLPILEKHDTWFTFHPFQSVIELSVSAAKVMAQLNIELMKARELPRKQKKRAKKEAFNKAMSFCLTEKYGRT